jgi:hypothetical protein
MFEERTQNASNSLLQPRQLAPVPCMSFDPLFVSQAATITSDLDSVSSGLIGGFVWSVYETATATRRAGICVVCSYHCDRELGP